MPKTPRHKEAPQSSLIQVIKTDGGPVKVPPGYQVWANGIFTVSEDALDGFRPSVEKNSPIRGGQGFERVLPCPMWISGMAKDEDGMRMIHLSYVPIGGKKESKWVKASVLSSPRGIGELDMLGLNITSHRADIAITFLSAMITCNRDMKLERTVNRDGYVEGPLGEYGWILGDYWIGDPQKRCGASPLSPSPFRGAFHEEGDPNLWIQTWQTLAKIHPVWRLTIATMAAAPLMRFRGIGQRTFIWYPYGGSGKGKSAAGRFAISALGDPEKLALSFNSTQNALAEPGAHISDMGVLFDEREAMQVKQQVEAKTWLYGICDEKIKSRVLQTGGMADKPKYKLLIIANGERRLVVGDVGGQQKRALEIPIADAPGIPNPENIHAIAKENYGMAMVAYLSELDERLRSDPQFETRTAKVFMDLNILLTKACQDLEVTTEDIRRVALVCLGDIYLHQVLLGTAFSLAFDSALAAGQVVLSMLERKGASLYDRGIEVLQSHMAAYPSKYVNKENTETDEVFGYMVDKAKKFEIWLNHILIDPVLEKNGIPAHEFWVSCREAGTLQTETGSGGLKVYRCPKRGQARFYVLDRKKVFPESTKVN